METLNSLTANQFMPSFAYFSNCSYWHIFLADKPDLNDNFENLEPPVVVHHIRCRARHFAKTVIHHLTSLEVGLRIQLLSFFKPVSTFAWGNNIIRRRVALWYGFGESQSCHVVCVPKTHLGVTAYILFIVTFLHSTRPHSVLSLVSQIVFSTHLSEFRLMLPVPIINQHVVFI